jgi:hypothetical protein
VTNSKVQESNTPSLEKSGPLMNIKVKSEHLIKKQIDFNMFSYPHLKAEAV